MKSDTVTNVDHLFSILNQRNQLQHSQLDLVFFTCFVTHQYVLVPCKVALQHLFAVSTLYRSRFVYHNFIFPKLSHSLPSANQISNRVKSELN